MRVIAGSARGHRLACLNGTDTRPTADKVKGAIFSMLGQEVLGKKVLDLFAGTGALGIEALSRGAQHCVFTDKNSLAANIILQNLTHTKLKDKSQTYVASWDFYMDKISPPDTMFDIIFLDPPYGKGFIQPVLSKIFQRNMSAPGGLIVLESEGEHLDHPHIIKSKTYGRTNIYLWRN